MSNTKIKYNFQFGKKPLPAYMTEKGNTIRLIVFTTIFSLLFINIFRPFNSETWIPNNTPYNYFIYSSLLVLIGMVVISLSRTIMILYTKKVSIGYFEYFFWVLVEAVILSIFYVIIANKVGFIDNFIKENEGMQYNDAIFGIFRKAVANTIWMLLIPYVISYLYFENEDLKSQKKKADEKGKEFIQFRDERGEIKFSVMSENIIYIESADNYAIIKYLSNNATAEFILRNSLKKLTEQLIDTSIQRCHRSFMVNFEHVVSLKKDNSDISIEFDVPNIKQIPISKSYNDNILESFMKYSRQNA